jgi:hypothetical protein
MRKNLTQPLLHVDDGASKEKAICYKEVDQGLWVAIIFGHRDVWMKQQ